MQTAYNEFTQPARWVAFARWFLKDKLGRLRYFDSADFHLDKQTAYDEFAQPARWVAFARWILEDKLVQLRYFNSAEFHFDKQTAYDELDGWVAND
jgi:hypothetical protein